MALFKFSAGIHHPGLATIFQIRELYFFEFTPISEPAPEVVKRIEKILKNPVSKFLIGKFLKPFMAAVSVIGDAGSHMVSYLIPNGVDYCFEVKDYRDTCAMYRYNGVEHKDSLGLSELIGLFGAAFGLIATIAKYLAKGAESAQKGLSALVALTDELTEFVRAQIEKVSGKANADLFARMIRDLQSGKLAGSFVVPTSNWTPFKFHDGGAAHNVALLAGPAKRTAVDGGFRSAVRLDFGGYVPNSWVAYNASTVIISPMSVSRGVFGVGYSSGNLRDSHATLLEREPAYPVKNPTSGSNWVPVSGSRTSMATATSSGVACLWAAKTTSVHDGLDLISIGVSGRLMPGSWPPAQRRAARRAGTRR